MPENHFTQAVLQQLLTESLPDVQESQVSDHLSTCPQCRQEFEVLAADNDWWTEATQRLSSRVDQDGGASIASGSIFEDEMPHFASDFAVDFLEPSDDAQALGRLGEYEIFEVTGHGGMGIVLKGFQKELHRHVAVKVLSPYLATSGAARKRFAREAQATAAVVHPHVMAIHSVNATAKLPYLVMPFVACQSLQERIDRLAPLEFKDVLRIGMQTASGLAAAHAQGLVHRDVKPANILLESNVDRVLLTDFGLARAVDDATLTRTGIIAGTPLYMSPEQANGDNVDHRSDLFSLGSVLYAMCTGRPPFRAETTFGVLRRIRETSPRPIREINTDIPEWFERIVTKLLARDVSARFGSADDVARLLEQCLAHVQQPMSVTLPSGVGDWTLIPESSGAGPGTWNGWIGRFSQRLAVVCLAAGMGVGLWIWWQNSRPAMTNQSSEASVSAVPAEAAGNDPSSAFNTSTQWNAIDSKLDEAESVIDVLEKWARDDETQPSQE